MQYFVNQHIKYRKSVFSDYGVLNPACSIFPLNLQMYAVTYRTDLLRGMNYKQSEGAAYTDQEWVFFPIFFVETVSFVNADVYQYLLGREGQTMDIYTYHKNVSHRYTSAMTMINYYYAFDRSILPEAKLRYLIDRLRGRILGVYKSWLAWQTEEEFNADMVKSFDTYIRNQEEDFYESLSQEKLYKYIPFRYIGYWRKNMQRPPSYLRWLMRIKHKIRQFLYRIS
jgi:hypothetical protein